MEVNGENLDEKQNVIIQESNHYIKSHSENLYLETGYKACKEYYN